MTILNHYQPLPTTTNHYQPLPVPTSELYGGLEWLLGLEAMQHIDENTLFDIIREMASFSGRQCDGYVTLKDFRASFTPNRNTFAVTPGAGGGTGR